MKRQALLATGALGIVGGALIYLFGGNMMVSIVCGMILFLLLWFINRPQRTVTVAVKPSEGADEESLLKEGKKQLCFIDDYLSNWRKSHNASIQLQIFFLTIYRFLEVSWPVTVNLRKTVWNLKVRKWCEKFFLISEKPWNGCGKVCLKMIS